MKESISKLLLSETEVTEKYGLTSQWLRRARMAGVDHGPPFIKLGSRIFYQESLIDKYLQDNLHTSGACGKEESSRIDRVLSQPFCTLGLSMPLRTDLQSLETKEGMLFSCDVDYNKDYLTTAHIYRFNGALVVSVDSEKLASEYPKCFGQIIALMNGKLKDLLKSNSLNKRFENVGEISAIAP